MMLTRIEIDGFKTFEKFGLDLRPLTAIVGPNASGKSNLFDALRFLSSLAKSDIRTAMRNLRGEPEELFRRTPYGNSDSISLAAEALLGRTGVDSFGTTYQTPARRIRYELKLAMARDVETGAPRGVFVREERCFPIAKKNDRADFLPKDEISYNSRKNPFVTLNEKGDALVVRQDGQQKRGRPLQLSLKEATRTALSTITTAEFPHLYALRDVLANLRFLEIVPGAARKPSDRFEEKVLRSDASNLPAVLAHLREKTASKERPNGVLSDIAADLASLIPSIRELQVESDPTQKQYSFALKFSGDMTFSSRVISDGTLRLLALLTVLNDPDRRGTLCFEEPENGVHEGRVPMLVEFLRQAAQIPAEAEFASFQILINTHSPKVMSALRDDEIVVADSVSSVDPKMGSVSTRTRMRTGITPEGDLFDPEFNLSRFEIDKLLQGANASLSRSEPPTTGAAITYSAAPPHRKSSKCARR